MGAGLQRISAGAGGLREALCTLGNGYVATRGAAPDCGADAVHYPGTYLAGGYNRLTTIAGRDVENEDLVNLPNWLPLTMRIDDGAWMCLDTVEIVAYRQELDLRQGVLRRTVRFRDPQGRHAVAGTAPGEHGPAASGRARRRGHRRAGRGA